MQYFSNPLTGQHYNFHVGTSCSPFNKIKENSHFGWPWLTFIQFYVRSERGLYQTDISTTPAKGPHQMNRTQIWAKCVTWPLESRWLIVTDCFKYGSFAEEPWTESRRFLPQENRRSAGKVSFFCQSRFFSFSVFAWNKIINNRRNLA